MNQETFADKLTLDEIAANDVEMVKDAIKNANKYNFAGDKMKAVLFLRDCLEKTLDRLGIHIKPPTNMNSEASQQRFEQALDVKMAEKQVVIEGRTNRYKGEDIWRNGIYIFQKDELVAFISDVLTECKTQADPLSMKILKEDIRFLVITNARVDDTKRIFLLH